MEALPFNRALKNNAISLNILNLRDFALDERGTVDEKPYGGGTGMILRVEPIVQALRHLNSKHTILLSPRGHTYTQQKAMQLSQKDEFTLICGRYEGVDARIEEHYTDETLSIGNYILSGGEVAALAIMESTVRLLEGMFTKEGVTQQESFSEFTIEHPQYTRPEDFEGHKVPQILLSGNHAEIEKWQKSQRTANTL